MARARLPFASSASAMMGRRLVEPPASPPKEVSKSGAVAKPMEMTDAQRDALADVVASAQAAQSERTRRTVGQGERTDSRLLLVGLAVLVFAIIPFLLRDCGSR